MAQMREIKGRLKAVGNIQRITRTMQMIATSKFQSAQRRALASQPYARRLSQMVAELAGSCGPEGLTHPLLSGPAQPTGRLLLLVLTSTRGLCGGFNANILRTAHQFLREQEGQTVEVEVVGRKGQIYFRFNRIPMARVHNQFGDRPEYEQVAALAEDYLQRFAGGGYEAVYVCYMQFVSNVRQVPQVARLLPMSRPEGTGQESSRQYDFSPPAEQLLEQLLPLTVKTALFQYFNETMVSEQIARMVAMKAATDNAEKMGKMLRRHYNRARQSQITNELIEVVSGAEAL